MDKQKLKKLIADVLETTPDLIDDNISMENTDIWDSLKHMEMVTGIEENFEIELSAEEMMEMTSFEAIRRVLGSKGIQC